MHVQVSAGDSPGFRAVVSPRLKGAYTVLAGAALATGAAAPTLHGYWFADVALVLSVLALWYEHRLLAGMTTLAVLAPELAWNTGFLLRLLGGVDPFGLAGPLFEPSAAAAARVVAPVHLVLPALLLWLVFRLGYDPRALAAQTLLGWMVLLLGMATAPLLGPGLAGTPGMSARLAGAWLPGWLWFGLLMLAYPALVYLPAHLLLQELFGPECRRSARALARFVRRRTAGTVLHARLRERVDLVLPRRRRR